MHTHKLFASLTLLSLLAVPTAGVAETTAADKFASGESFVQDIVMTAYYSPKPDQCCYVTGSFDSDVTLNGRGTNGADGTEVYPGMIAAPSSYPFGTRVSVPGLGVFTVHDRGGAIVEQGAVHRIDVWAGEGEDGLARALAFGVRKAKATVYPPSAIADAPADSFALGSLPSPLERLTPYAVESASLLHHAVALGDHSVSVKTLQEDLRGLGFLREKATGFFGEATQTAIRAVSDAYRLEGQPDDHLSERVSATVKAALLRKAAKEPIAKRVDRRSDVRDVAALQRTLRFIGAYDGRTDGRYDDDVRAAVIAFQKRAVLISDATSPGAGIVGPKTREAILRVWNRKHVNLLADRLLERQRVATLVAEHETASFGYLGKGKSGKDVASLQRYLAVAGFFPTARINGSFGDLTEGAVLAYQQARGIIAKAGDKGAGYVGPATLMTIRGELRAQLWDAVRAQGWTAATQAIL